MRSFTGMMVATVVVYRQVAFAVDRASKLLCEQSHWAQAAKYHITGWLAPILLKTAPLHNGLP